MRGMGSAPGNERGFLPIWAGGISSLGSSILDWELPQSIKKLYTCGRLNVPGKDMRGFLIRSHLTCKLASVSYGILFLCLLERDLLGRAAADKKDTIRTTTYS